MNDKASGKEKIKQFDSEKLLDDFLVNHPELEVVDIKPMYPKMVGDRVISHYLLIYKEKNNK